jgi:tRNA threonylcarbamoyladenosine biosynthesis protein TsaB
MNDQPRLLIIETSGRGGLVALARGETLCGQHQLQESRRHGRDLAPLTAELLEAQGWRAHDLEGVIVSLGPGSYTGLRVGLMAAKALAYATGCELIAVETFDAIAEQTPENVQRLDVIADAQQQRVYLRSYLRENGMWTAATPLTIRELQDWLDSRDPGAWISGPGVDVHAEVLSGLNLIDAQRRSPGAEALLRLGLRRFRAGERDDLWKLEPTYLRPSSAEEQWQRRGARLY